MEANELAIEFAMEAFMSDRRYRILRSSGKCLKLLFNILTPSYIVALSFLAYMLYSKMESEFLSLPYILTPSYIVALLGLYAIQ